MLARYKPSTIPLMTNKKKITSTKTFNIKVAEFVAEGVSLPVTFIPIAEAREKEERARPERGGGGGGGGGRQGRQREQHKLHDRRDEPNKT